MALVSRLLNTLVSASRSVQIRIGCGVSWESCIPFCWAADVKRCTVFSTRSSMSNQVFWEEKASCSAFVKSRIWFTRSSNRSLLRLTTSRSSLISSGIFFWRMISSTGARISVTGVRISWVIWVKNPILASNSLRSFSWCKAAILLRWRRLVRCNKSAYPKAIAKTIRIP